MPSIDISELTYEEVKKWVVANSDDKQAMDDLNKLTYVFTSKYSERSIRDNREAGRA